MLTTTLAPLIAVLGALAYALSGNAKLSEMGRIAFFAGLLATLLALGGRGVHF